jgi:hypothetical protein
MRILILTAVVLCSACSSESTSNSRNNPSAAPQCGAGAVQSCSCPTGTGMQTCSAAGTWGACMCITAPPDDNFGNPDPVTPVVDAGGPQVPDGNDRPCSPGFYFGTYDCELTIFGLPLELTGDVSFNLSINEMMVDQECPPSEEFCPDLVISENGGTLYGIGAGFYGFETMLQGALDCTTGEFRATGFDGRWGTAISSDPNDPNALWTVEDPPLGMFDGTFMGMHTAGSGETIAGDWDLYDSVADIRCAGPFSVTLQP